MRLLRVLSVLCVLVVATSSCSDPISDAQESNEICGLLSVAEVEAAVGLELVEIIDESETAENACSWHFDVDSNAPDGYEPLVVVIFSDAEEGYEIVANNPDAPQIDGVGDSAVMLGARDVVFVANGFTGRVQWVSPLWGEPADVPEDAIQQIAGLVADRL